jgi:putative membrane protein
LTPAREDADTAAVRRDTGNEALASALLGWGVNIVALLVIDSIFDGVEIGRWGSVLIGAAVLGIGNAILKPVLAVLTLPLIIVTLGVSYFAINVAMLAFAEWIAPNFSIDGFWTYVGATIVVWLVNWILNSLLGSLFGGR